MIWCQRKTLHRKRSASWPRASWKKIELNWLSAFYGGLLTPKQRDVMRMHCEEDLSLGEIAQEAGISRQAVHDLLSRAAHQLFELEGKLGMAARFTRMQRGLEQCQQALEEKALRRRPGR